jgi:hypothetical protein
MTHILYGMLSIIMNIKKLFIHVKLLVSISQNIMEGSVSVGLNS